MNSTKIQSAYTFLLAGLVLLSLSCSDQKEEKDLRTRLRASGEIQSAIQSVNFSLNKQALLKDAEGTEQPLVNLPFKNPPEIKAINGKLDTEIDLKFTENQLYNTILEKNITLYHRSYNGQLVGPTLRIKPGDSLLVNLVNNLPVYEDPGPCNPYQQLDDGKDPNEIDTLRFNNTNLHTHGFHVSPMAHGDNVFVNLAPGCSFQNRILLPTNHAPGTFWYHAHMHGSTAIQVSSGMGGAILIEGGLDDQPEIQQMDEKVFVLQQMPYTPDTMVNKSSERFAIKFIEGVTFGPGTWGDGIKDSTGWKTTINGQTLPVIEIQSEEVQRWRFIHAGVRETVNLKLVDVENGEEIVEKLYAIAEDGIAYGYRDDVDSMVLQPGYRADILVQAKLDNGLDKDTLYLIDANSPVLDETDQGEAETEKVLAVVVLIKPTGEPIANRLPSSESLKAYAPYPSLVDTLVNAEAQKVRFDIIPGDITLFQVNGVSFNHLNEPRLLELNTVQDWKLTSSLASHPFHIHINHFQIMERWRKMNNENEYKKLDTKPIWKDTYFVENVGNKKDEDGNVIKYGYKDSSIVKTVYKDFVGDFVLHCHILDHEDQGMMQCVRIDSANQIGQYLLDEGIQFCGPKYSNSLSKQ